MVAAVVAVGINTDVSLHFQCYVGKCMACGVFTKSGVGPIPPPPPPTHTHTIKIELLIFEYYFKLLM